jgi:glycosyltransferase involved in cell wall biosynthesis
VLSWAPDWRLPKVYSVAESQDEDVLTIRLSYNPTLVGRLGRGYALWRLLGRLAKQRWRPDVIHAHVYTAAQTALFAGRLFGAPVVLSEHLSDIARGTLSSREVRAAQRAYRAVAVICPVSDDLGRRVKQLADGTELITVPNPVDTELFRPNPSKDELGSRGPAEARLLTVGNLVEVKGHRYLIEACRGLRGDGLIFIV